MKVGDKVRFLSTTGGGIVKGFQGKEIALVEDEDGFDIPVLMRECVIIQPEKDAQVRQQHQREETIQEILSPYQPHVQEPVYIPEETKGGDLITVCLAYLPVDQKTLSSTNFECYLVNDSNYYLSYNYLSQVDEGWISRQAGIIEPNTKLFVEEFEKTELNDMERICLQLIAYKKDKPFSLKNSYSIDLHIDTVKFYKLHSFRDNDFFDEDALVYTLVRKDLPEKELKVVAEDLELAIKEKLHNDRPRIQSARKKEEKEVLEIDLHIDELLDTTSGLSSGDILEYQLNKFNEIMGDNAKRKGQKIVFIHGKGDGVLKNALLKELKTKYKTAYYQDASFREYGYGATMITIK